MRSISVLYLFSFHIQLLAAAMEANVVEKMLIILQCIRVMNVSGGSLKTAVYIDI
jgi:hypothetical protein